MSKTYGQKNKLLTIRKILFEETDENNPISTAELIARLEETGIRCERKTIYDDIECLRAFGDDIGQHKGKKNGYYIASRTFELPELKLLVDAVESSKFIPKQKSDILISKLTTLTNEQRANELKRVVVAANKVKTENNKVYNTVDVLHKAILGNNQVSFKYYNLDRRHNKIYHRNGKKYIVSPYTLIWDDENYYLIAYDHETGSRRHFRVDKIESIYLLENTEREGAEVVGELHPESFSKNVFGMFGGQFEMVTLRCKNSTAGAIFDRFGQKTTVRIIDEELFEITIKVAISPKFFSWIFAFDGAIEIASPANVAKQYKAMIKRNL